MIGFVVALFREAEYFINSASDVNKCTLAGKTLYIGKFCNKDFVLILSGIGKVNAALATQALIDTYKPDFIINFGTAGGANENVKHLSYYLVEKCCQYDFNLSELDNVSVGFIEGYNTIHFDCKTNGLSFMDKAVLGTADMFSNKLENINTVRALSCDLRDMEGGAIAEVCASNNYPLYMIKGVTDTYDNPAKQFYENLVTVCKGFPDVLNKVINSLCR